jgi:hypothetical protein
MIKGRIWIFIAAGLLVLELLITYMDITSHVYYVALRDAVLVLYSVLLLIDVVKKASPYRQLAHFTLCCFIFALVELIFFFHYRSTAQIEILYAVIALIIGFATSARMKKLKTR